MKTLTISLLIFIQTTALCFGQANIERETKNVKVIKEWQSIIQNDVSIKIIAYYYELKVEGEDEDCGNWVLGVTVANYDPTLYRTSGVASISIKTKYCPYSFVYSAYNASVITDGNITVSENYSKNGGAVKIEKLSDGSYRLIGFVRSGYDGALIQTYRY